MSSAERQTKRRRLMDPDRVPSGDVEAISPQIVSDWASMEAVRSLRQCCSRCACWIAEHIACARRMQRP